MAYDLLRKSYDAKWVENPIFLSFFKILGEVCKLLKAKPLSRGEGLEHDLVID